MPTFRAGGGFPGNPKNPPKMGLFWALFGALFGPFLGVFLGIFRGRGPKFPGDEAFRRFATVRGLH